MPEERKIAIIRRTTKIAAPISRVFDLSRSIDLEKELIQGWGGDLIDGCRSGLAGNGDTVTWRLWEFGFRVTHKTRVRGVVMPSHFADCYFQDYMEQGIFTCFQHDHYFTATGDSTMLRDELRFQLPWYLLGALSSQTFVRRRLESMLTQRNAKIQHAAETEAWRRFLPG